MSVCIRTVMAFAFLTGTIKALPMLGEAEEAGAEGVGTKGGRRGHSVVRRGRGPIDKWEVVFIVVVIRRKIGNGGAVSMSDTFGGGSYGDGVGSSVACNEGGT